MEESLLDIKTVAKRLNVSDRMIYKLVNLGELETVKIGKVYRFTNEAVRQYIDRQTVRTARTDER